MVYYRVATRMQRIHGVSGLEYVWMFVSPLHTERQHIYMALNLLHKDPYTMVFAGSTPERVEGHMIRFVDGLESVCWTRLDFLSGIPTDSRAVLQAEEVIYQPKTVEEAAEEYMKVRRRLEFYKMLYNTGRLSEEGEETA